MLRSQLWRRSCAAHDASYDDYATHDAAQHQPIHSQHFCPGPIGAHHQSERHVWQHYRLRGLEVRILLLAILLVWLQHRILRHWLSISVRHLWPGTSSGLISTTPGFLSAAYNKRTAPCYHTDHTRLQRRPVSQYSGRYAV